MARLFITALTAVLLLATPLQAFNWSGVFTQVQKSVVQVFSEGGSTCTAFSIDQEKKYYLTAAHCLPEDMEATAERSKTRMDQPSPTGMYLWKEAIPGVVTQGTAIVTRVLKVSSALDLAVLQANLGLPAIERGAEPRIGEEIIALGYMFGEPTPYLKAGNVANVKSVRGNDGTLHQLIIRTSAEIAGDSGGPVLNIRGRLVSIVHGGVRYRGQVVGINYGVGIGDIARFAKGYWME